MISALGDPTAFPCPGPALDTLLLLLQLCVVMIFLVSVIMYRGIVSMMMYHTGNTILMTQVSHGCCRRDWGDPQPPPSRSAASPGTHAGAAEASWVFLWADGTPLVPGP